jgi:hypothetical protein
MRPQFPTDYNIGHIGFTYVPGFTSAGVAYFERWHRLSKIQVTHALIVSGDNECIEAHLDEGVARVSLDKYFNDPATRIFFRQPRGWTPELGSRYNTSLILAEAAGDTWLGYWCNRLLRAWPNRLLSRVLDRPGRWICSQLVAHALAQQPELRNLGILRFPPDTIDPQELFEDQTIFAPSIIKN